jgi:hypothetical protein
MLVKKHITLRLCRRDLLDDDMAVVCIHSLPSPLSCRAIEALVADPARVEEVFLPASRVLEELLCKGPEFAASLTLPSG